MMIIRGVLLLLLFSSSNSKAADDDDGYRVRDFSGGFEFYDFKEDHIGQKVVQWSDNAPEWRVHCRGANLIGTCYNSNCKAFGRKVVAGLGYGDHVVARQGRMMVDTKCPVCKHKIGPKTCAFNRCYYRVTGKKSTTNTLVKTDWHRVGNECLLYDEDDNTDFYSGLKIECRHENDPPEQEEEDL